MLVLACGRGGRAGLVHAVHRLCRGAELRGGLGRADLINQRSVRLIVGEPPRTVEDREPAVRVFVNAHVRLDEVAAVALLGDLQHTALVTDRVVVPHHAVCLDAQDVVERPQDAQVAQLKAAGAEKVFREKVSGARANRPELARLLRALSPGDVVLVTRLDRLARSPRDLLNTLAAIADKQAGFRSLSDTWADTTTPHGRLMLTVLGGLAEFERDLIRTRTGEGRARAKARGVKLGRKPKLTPHQKREAIARRDRGDETHAEIGRSYNVSGWTISRLAG